MYNDQIESICVFFLSLSLATLFGCIHIRHLFHMWFSSLPITTQYTHTHLYRNDRLHLSDLQIEEIKTVNKNRNGFFVFFPVPFSLSCFFFGLIRIITHTETPIFFSLSVCINNIELDKESIWIMWYWHLPLFHLVSPFILPFFLILFRNCKTLRFSNKVLLVYALQLHLGWYFEAIAWFDIWYIRLNDMNEQHKNTKPPPHAVEIILMGRLSFWRFEFVLRRSIILINVKILYFVQFFIESVVHVVLLSHYRYILHCVCVHLE